MEIFAEEQELLDVDDDKVSRIIEQVNRLDTILDTSPAYFLAAPAPAFFFKRLRLPQMSKVKLLKI